MFDLVGIIYNGTRSSVTFYLVCGMYYLDGVSIIVLDISLYIELLYKGFIFSLELSYCMELEDLVKNYRRIIDEAKDNNEFRGLYPFDNFPKDCCRHASDLLANYLIDNGYDDIKIVNGACFDDYTKFHVWILTGDNKVDDITLDQFRNDFVDIIEDLAPVYIGEEDRLHKIYSEDRVYENISNVKEREYDQFGVSNVYQSRLVDIYNVIKKYL